ncbi:Nucleoplasmin-3 [Galemys pyrenaicus]|uniref:Nucleoplasmin-3 n=1 Tax=Galemys pyrenaicus TaxID=202257 RepID=A0A8J6AM39_GALPY|nr:Nucleoplasmin-3 [Galemys pyrenaicus]
MAAGAAAALAFLSQESRVRAGGVGGLRIPAPVTMDSFFFGIGDAGGAEAVRGRTEEQEGKSSHDVGGGLAHGSSNGSGWRDPCPRSAGRGPGPCSPSVPVEMGACKWTVSPGPHMSDVCPHTLSPCARTHKYLNVFLTGCELSGHTRSFTFKVEEEDDAEHMLALTMLCLTEGAKDECNVVEVVARNHDRQEIAVPVANLKLSCQPMLSLDDFQLQPPVTFRLKSGSGPVRITGRHQIVSISNDLSEEEESEEGSEEEAVELCPILPAKKQRGRP